MYLAKVSGAGRVVVTKGKYKVRMKYNKAKSLDLDLIDYTQFQLVHMLPPFVFMMERYMYWTMLHQWRLVIARLQRI